MKYIVVGTGGVGGYFGAKLAQAGNEVWFIARGEHLRAMRTSGLTVRSRKGDFNIPPGKMTDRIEEAGSAAVILFCVKSYDTEDSARMLPPVVAEDTIVISLQNGIDNEGKIRKALPRGLVYGGTTYIYSTITSPGVVTETGGITNIIFGPLGGQRHEASDQGILHNMVAAGLNATFTPDIESAIWKKFIFISTVGGLTALTRLTLKELLSVAESRELLVQALREVEAIARARTIDVGEKYLDSVFDMLNKIDKNTRSSMYHDLVHDKPIEIEAFSGTVVRLGSELGISTPIHKTIYSCLLPYQKERMAKRG